MKIENEIWARFLPLLESLLPHMMYLKRHFGDVRESNSFLRVVVSEQEPYIDSLTQPMRIANEDDRRLLETMKINADIKEVIGLIRAECQQHGLDFDAMKARMDARAAIVTQSNLFILVSMSLNVQLNSLIVSWLQHTVKRSKGKIQRIETKPQLGASSRIYTARSPTSPLSLISF